MERNYASEDLDRKHRVLWRNFVNLSAAATWSTRPGADLGGMLKNSTLWESQQRILSRLMVDLLLKGYLLSGEWRLVGLK